MYIYTIQMGKIKGYLKNGYSKDLFLDITVKSGDKTFAPSWDIVMAHKNGIITDQQYIDGYTNKNGILIPGYRQMMQDSFRDNTKRWKELLAKDVVVFSCFCDSNKFCHRFVLANYFVRLGATYITELDGTKLFLV